MKDWGVQLATTLSYLHQRGVVHRDLKPESVLVGSDGLLKICDFGAALRQNARRLTWRHLADAIGTPEYMSPEQVQGRRGDARSDIYTLGVILYELVAGVSPFSGGTWQETMSMHLTGSPAALPARRADIPAGLEAVIRRCLRRRPEDRYQNAEELLADLATSDRGGATGAASLPDPRCGAWRSDPTRPCGASPPSSRHHSSGSSAPSLRCPCCFGSPVITSVVR